MISKHLMPVFKELCSSFYASGSQMLQKKLTGTSLFFCTNVTKLRLETKQVLRGLMLFSQSLFISKVLIVVFFGGVGVALFFLFFFYFVCVIFNCQHCSVHKMFCKEEMKNL